MFEFLKSLLKNNNYNSCNNTKEESISNDSIIKPINPTQVKEYKIAGVTFENEDKKDIQKEIKKILREYVKNEYIDKDDMYLGYTNSDIKDLVIEEVSQYEDIKFGVKLKEDTFEDKPCIKVYMKRADGSFTHVGYIQKRYNQINEVLEIMHNCEIEKMELYVVGGKIKKCEVEEDEEYKEHFYVETIDLDYGLRLFINYRAN